MELSSNSDDSDSKTESEDEEAKWGDTKPNNAAKRMKRHYGGPSGETVKAFEWYRGFVEDYNADRMKYCVR